MPLKGCSGSPKVALDISPKSIVFFKDRLETFYGRSLPVQQAKHNNIYIGGIQFGAMYNLFAYLHHLIDLLERKGVRRI